VDTPSYDAFAIAAPGLAPLVGAELGELGIVPTDVDAAGVAFRADASALYRANLHLRIATRVIVRAAAFRAAHFSDLEKQARQIPWERWLWPGAALAIRVTSRKSRLFHTDAIASRLLEAATARVPGIRGATVKGDDEAAGDLLLVVRIDRDLCTISVDSSGGLLHRRGYRVEVGKAPLRETLAAAILRGATWTGQAPLLDPFCGSGTIPIEAALLARQWRRAAAGLRVHPLAGVQRGAWRRGAPTAAQALPASP
jgi:putative N6-adenine-specific DNA methylase